MLISNVLLSLIINIVLYGSVGYLYKSQGVFFVLDKRSFHDFYSSLLLLEFYLLYLLLQLQHIFIWL